MSGVEGARPDHGDSVRSQQTLIAINTRANPGPELQNAGQS